MRMKLFSMRDKRKYLTIQCVTLLLLSLFLTSCGFHLRGPTVLSPRLQRLYIKSKSPYGELTRNIQQYLKMSDIAITDSPQDATAILDIISETTTQQLVGVSGTQQTRQYNLILTVNFQITDTKGVALTFPDSLSESRTLPINSGEILSGSNEAAALYQQMRRTIVFTIMNRLSSREVTQILAHERPIQPLQPQP